MEGEPAENGPLANNVVERAHPDLSVHGVRRHDHTELLGVSCAPVWVAVAVYGANRTSPPTRAVVAVPELFRRFVPMIVTTTPAIHHMA